MSIAFFDIDLTILSVNSARLWIKHELRDGRLSKTQALKGAWWALLYEMGFANMEAAVEKAMASLQGEVEDELAARTHRFYENEIQAKWRPGARKTIEKHQKQGHTIAILSSSSNYMSSLVAKEVGAEEILCNRFEVQEGVLTGQPIRPLCFGPGKLTHARALAEKMQIELQNCYFYTDSYSDLPVLEEVGYPTVVHPDPRLKKEANRQGWPIADWMA